MGTTQFIRGVAVGEVTRSILPFYAVLLTAFFLVTYVPAFSLTPPRPLGH